MIAGTNTLGADFGRVVRVDWQTRDSDWLIDDLAVTCMTVDGHERAAGISVKTHEQLSSSGFSPDFTRPAWMQWLGLETSRVFRRGIDAIVLATGELDGAVKAAWTALCTQVAAVGADPARLAERLIDDASRDGSQSSQTQRAIFESLRKPADLGPEVDGAERVSFLRDLRVLHFDLRNPNASDVADVIRACQVCLISGDAEEACQLWDRLVGIADELRPLGGSLALSGLLGMLRGQFRLRDHPDYTADWTSLNRLGAEAASDVDEQIGGQSIDRAAASERLEVALASKQVQLLVGESGSGKSALSKRVAVSSFPRFVWLTGGNLNYANEPAFEHALGLAHPLTEVLRAAPESCLVVLDGAEGYSQNALHIAGHLISGLADGSGVHVRVVVTVQFEAASAVMRDLVRHGAPEIALATFPFDRPRDEEINALLAALPQLGWVAHRPEVRPLLSNLKVLDLAARTLRLEQALSSEPVRGLTGLIDVLWDDWAGEGAAAYSRTHVLQSIAAAEADHLSVGVTRLSLGYAEQQALKPLEQSGLVRVRDERVVFAHDLIGDWARLRVLVGDSPLFSLTSRERVKSPRWQKAVRLFGQRLLEQTDSGLDQWRRIVEDASDQSEDAKLMRDLFLDALFLATDAARLLERAWPALVAANGSLLGRLLDRFLFVGTLPDARMLVLLEGFDPQVVEHAFRVPFWPYWPPVISVLHAHADEVVQCARQAAARVCALWLRATPAEIQPGHPMPWRHEAAELALVIARETQARSEEDRFWGGDEPRVVLEAALYGAGNLPRETAELFLELARRRDLSPPVAERVQVALERRRAERRAAPDEPRAWSGPVGFPRGRRRAPWPDGPRSAVNHTVRDVCLDGTAFVSLVKADPNAALEVLLAICIEEPKHDDYMSSSAMEDYGLAFWHAGEPPMYFRGPFLQFMREAPEQGLTFALRLINFATARCVGKQRWGVTVRVDGHPKLWLGDSRIFRWHHDWPTGHGGALLQSVLMALERWFYEQIEQERDVGWAARWIIGESESVAFAGLLLDIGKRHPRLFGDVLKPLFTAGIFWDWDWSITTLRANGQSGMLGYWGGQPPQAIKLGRDWYRMPHRRVYLLAPDGPIARDFLSKEEHRPFFAAVRADWRRQLAESNSESGHLRLIVERIDPANYTYPADGEEGEISFAWPAEFARENEEHLQRTAEQQNLTSMPYRCRKILDVAQPAGEDQLLPLLSWLQTLDERQPVASDDGDDEPLQRLESVLTGGIAVLAVLHLGWLKADPIRIAWCRNKLQAIADNPPPIARFDSELSVGSERWDAFAAECGVRLLADDPSDPLARKLAALGVTDFHYSTAGLTMTRAFAARRELGGEFHRLIALTLRWAALRAVNVRGPDDTLQAEQKAWPARKAALIREFIDGTLPLQLPDIGRLNRDALAEREALHRKRFPQYVGARQRRGRSRRAREKLPPELLGFDERVLTAGFGWLNVSAASSPEERARLLDLIRTFLDLVLANLPETDDPNHQEIDGLPTDFDGWVFSRAAEAIVVLSPAEGSALLWEPILNLGAPGHHWVERFYWNWFTDGVRAAASPQQFVTIWRTMIEFALASPRWDRTTQGSYALDEMVFELLGFDSRWGGFLQNPEYTAAVGFLSDVFSTAVGKWFAMQSVTRGFLRFVVQPAASRLLLPALSWLGPIFSGLRDYGWRDGVEEALVNYLRRCWELEGSRIANDAQLKQAFLALVATAVARGSHPALALSDQIAG
jgi:hypothetical protein